MGVTGSGKTEVYVAAIDVVLKKGRQAIVLIPEIALTYQTVRRFYERFGDRVSIMNSRLSQGERYDQMLRAQNGEVDIMIGPRSALFTPFQNLGLIVIDEEHESSYKSESVPKYHARETADCTCINGTCFRDFRICNAEYRILSKCTYRHISFVAAETPCESGEYNGKCFYRD